jgi:hypothetical protein
MEGGGGERWWCEREGLGLEEGRRRWPWNEWPKKGSVLLSYPFPPFSQFFSCRSAKFSILG